MHHSSPAYVWQCFVLVFNGATTGVEEVRTQLKAHLPECFFYLRGDEGGVFDEDGLHEDEDDLDEDGDEGGLDGDEDEDE